MPAAGFGSCASGPPGVAERGTPFAERGSRPCSRHPPLPPRGAAMPALSLLLTAALSCAPAAHPIVTEVYYDAPGVDTGYEFVELANTRDVWQSLTGVRLEAGDGAGP